MIEVEVKLAIGPAPEETQRLQALGASLEHPRALEESFLLDTGGGRLARRGAMLRVRRYGVTGGTLTLKEPARGAEGYKVRREIESAIDDPDALLVILQAAGFEIVWRYAKYRTALRAGDVRLLVDETPIGNFLEIEGSESGIDDVVRRLGRDRSECLTETYRDLMARWCSARGRPLTDMVFEPEGAP